MYFKILESFLNFNGQWTHAIKLNSTFSTATFSVPVPPPTAQNLFQLLSSLEWIPWTELECDF